MSQSFKLYRLQKLDSTLDQKQARLREIEIALGESRELEQAEVCVSRAAERLRQAQKALRKTEADTQAQRAKIEATERKLFGGKVKNPKVLQDLQMESAALKRYLEVLEERQLEAMIALDEAQETHHLAQQELEKVRATSIESQAALKGERSLLRGEVERLKSEREAAVRTIPAAALQLYEQLRQSRGGVAVAQVAEKNCAACGSSLSSSLLQLARSPNQLTRCDTCGRILYAGRV
jgi:hypothetical protein